MNERITRLKEDYARNAEKIASLQAKNKKLAEKIRQLEDSYIVGSVRASGVNIDELLSLLGKNDNNKDCDDKTINTKNELEETDNEI